MTVVVPILLTVEEAAERLQIGRTAVYELIRRGRLPVVKIGRLTRVRPEALEAFCRATEKEGL